MKSFRNPDLGSLIRGLALLQACSAARHVTQSNSKTYGDSRTPMAFNDPILALSLMSGTSCDGIDAALVRTDGRSRVECGAVAKHIYTPSFRSQLRSVMGGRGAVKEVARELTLQHARVIEELL